MLNEKPLISIIHLLEYQNSYQFTYITIILSIILNKNLAKQPSTKILSAIIHQIFMAYPRL